MKNYIKCDASNCGYVEFVETITQDLVGKRCPKCSSDMLTQKDYNEWVAVKNIVLVSDWIGKAMEFFGFKPKRVTLSLGKEDVLPGETYAQALVRKTKKELARAEKDHDT